VALIAIVACGCGRIGFSPMTGDAGGDASGDGVHDGVTADAAPLGMQIADLRASNADAGDQFGLALALSRDGTTLAVAAPTEASAATGIDGDQSDNTAVDAGAVYLFTREASGWTQQAYIKASNTEANDQFGWAVALSGDGNTLAVGARHEDSAAVGINGSEVSNAAANAGAVYVFVRTGTTWTQQAYIKASNTGASDNFGAALALDDGGDTLVIGAAQEDSASTGVGGNPNDETAQDAGAAYVYARAGATWSPAVYLKATNADAGDAFGWKVAISGDGSTIAVGAPKESSASAMQPSDNSLSQSGAIYIYRRAGATWSADQLVKASNPELAANFGYSVGLSQDGATLVGAAVDEAGAARGFNGGSSMQSATSSGAAYLSIGTPYQAQAYAKASNADPGDDFGWSVALASDGSTFAAGAPNEQSLAMGLDGDEADNSLTMVGAAYVAARAGTTWTYAHYVKAPNADRGDQFGWALALSGDGTILAVGAPGEDGVGDAVPDAGEAYVYY